MDARLERVVALGRAVARETRAEKVTFLAGSLAYHAFVSLLPLLLLVWVAITAVGGQSLQQGFILLVQTLLSPGASDVKATELFLSELRKTGASAGVSLLGVAVLLWGTLRIFRGLDTAFSDIYETAAENTFLDQLTDGLLVLVAFAVALVVAGVLQRTLPGADAGPVWWLLQQAVLVGGLALVLYPVYYVFPDADVTPLEVVPGTLFAAAGLTLFQSLFRFYVAISGKSPESNVITGILVLLTWLYASGLVVLEGAVVNAVLANRSSDVDVEPLVGDAAGPAGEGGGSSSSTPTAED